MRPLDVVVGSMGGDTVHVPHLDRLARPGEPVSLEVHHERPDLKVGLDQIPDSAPQLSVHSLDHVRRRERQRQETVHEPPEAPETTPAAPPVLADEPLPPHVLQQSLRRKKNSAGYI